MSLFSLIKEHRQTFESTPEGQQKALKRKKVMGIGKTIAIILLASFAILFVIVTLNNHFHWWVTLPWNEEQISTSEPTTSLIRKAFL